MNDRNYKLERRSFAAGVCGVCIIVMLIAVAVLTVIYLVEVMS